MSSAFDPIRLAGSPTPGSPGGGSPGAGEGGGTGFDLATETRIKTKKPSLYRVLLLNDDYTPMEFVVFILERFFNRSREQATRIMLHVHQKGVGLCGVYTYEVAETKVAQVLDLARRHEHPLQCVMEKDD
jgi:ATP-dependent Clp protease adaptor protein ClpS